MEIHTLSFIFVLSSYQGTPGYPEKFSALTLSCKEPQKPSDGLSEHSNFCEGGGGGGGATAQTPVDVCTLSTPYIYWYMFGGLCSPPPPPPTKLTLDETPAVATPVYMLNTER